MRPQVFVTRQIPTPAVNRLAEVCDYQIGAESGVLDRDSLLAGVSDANGLICLLTDTIDREVINAGTRIRVIANVAVGYNNIDVAAARERGVHVTNTPDVLTEATANLTWALILAVTRRIVEADAFTRAGKFTGWDIDMLLGSGITGKTLGVVGYGRIGRAVARRATGFGMQVVYCGRDDIAFRDDPHHNSIMLARQGGTSPLSQSARLDGLAARRVTFYQLLEMADIITLHLPLAAATNHLINAPAFARMKPGAYLINTSRGPVVDEAALVEALRQRLIAGAGLDVYEHEPEISAPLKEMSNVVLLPHIGSATLETRTAMARLAVENVIDALQGRTPRSVVR
ncbi:MAG TPA: D-glycerate dehydrogenase [Blastocatellia bacterium]|jgi:glyoxylate reductase|nr:D-glycerate dehydrogenase [Blastocatellia bacterium]